MIYISNLSFILFYFIYFCILHEMHSSSFVHNIKAKAMLMPIPRTISMNTYEYDSVSSLALKWVTVLCNIIQRQFSTHKKKYDRIAYRFTTNRPLELCYSDTFLTPAVCVCAPAISLFLLSATMYIFLTRTFLIVVLEFELLAFCGHVVWSQRHISP